jgi:hypothetical protein
MYVDELILGELAVEFHHGSVFVLERVLWVGDPGI